jgi:hypothetical protein
MGWEASTGDEDDTTTVGMVATVVAEAVDGAKGVAEVLKAVAEAVDSVMKQDSTSWNRRQGAQERSRSMRASSRHRSRKVIGESNEKLASIKISGRENTWRHFYRSPYHFPLLHKPSSEILPFQVQPHNLFRASVSSVNAPNAIANILVIEPPWKRAV